MSALAVISDGRIKASRDSINTIALQNESLFEALKTSQADGTCC